MDPAHYRAPLPPLPLFDDPKEKQTPPDHLKGLARSPDRATSIAAAEKAASSREQLKARVLAAFREHGDMNDGELELLPEFAGIPINSVRKRRTDLLQDGLLEASGSRRGHPLRPSSQMTVWRLK